MSTHSVPSSSASKWPLMRWLRYLITCEQEQAAETRNDVFYNWRGEMIVLYTPTDRIGLLDDTVGNALAAKELKVHAAIPRRGPKPP